MPSVPNTNTAKATVASWANWRGASGLVHLLERERHPGAAERFRIDTQDIGDGAAQLIDTDVRQRAEEPQEEPVGHHRDLLQQRVRDARQAVAQHLSRLLPREAPDRPLDHAREAGDHHHRDQQVGQHDAEHAHSEADHQQQASRCGAEAAADCPPREPRRLVPDAEQAVGDAQECLQETVQGKEAKRPGMLGRAEQHAAEGGRPGKQHRQHHAASKADGDERCARERSARRIVAAIVMEAQERLVQPKLIQRAQKGAQQQEQAEHAVLRRRQDACIDREQQEADAEQEDLPRSIDRQVGEDPADVGEHRRMIAVN